MNNGSERFAINAESITITVAGGAATTTLALTIVTTASIAAAKEQEPRTTTMTRSPFWAVKPDYPSLFITLCLFRKYEPCHY
jgi:hypothetical protein